MSEGCEFQQLQSFLPGLITQSRLHFYGSKLNYFQAIYNAIEAGDPCFNSKFDAWSYIRLLYDFKLTINSFFQFLAVFWLICTKEAYETLDDKNGDCESEASSEDDDKATGRRSGGTSTGSSSIRTEEGINISVIKGSIAAQQVL